MTMSTLAVECRSNNPHPIKAPLPTGAHKLPSKIKCLTSKECQRWTESWQNCWTLRIVTGHSWLSLALSLSLSLCTHNSCPCHLGQKWLWTQTGREKFWVVNWGETICTQEAQFLFLLGGWGGWGFLRIFVTNLFHNVPIKLPLVV
jgi:hypothetical protein